MSVHKIQKKVQLSVSVRTFESTVLQLRERNKPAAAQTPWRSVLWLRWWDWKRRRSHHRICKRHKINNVKKESLLHLHYFTILLLGGSTRLYKYSTYKVKSAVAECCQLLLREVLLHYHWPVFTALIKRSVKLSCDSAWALLWYFCTSDMWH